MSFKADLEVGRAYEREVADLFESLTGSKFELITKDTHPHLYKKVDLLEIDSSKHFSELVSLECKYSGDKHNDSPNVVIEYSSYRGETSGICTSLSWFWVFRIADKHLVTRRDELIKLIIYDLAHDEKHRRIKMKNLDHKKLMLVPIELLVDLEICPSSKTYSRILQ